MSDADDAIIGAIHNPQTGGGWMDQTPESVPLPSSGPPEPDIGAAVRAAVRVASNFSYISTKERGEDMNLILETLHAAEAALALRQAEAERMREEKLNAQIATIRAIIEVAQKQQRDSVSVDLLLDLITLGSLERLAARTMPTGS